MTNHTYLPMYIKCGKLTEGGEEEEEGRGEGGGEKLSIIIPAAAASFFVACLLGTGTDGMPSMTGT